MEDELCKRRNSERERPVPSGTDCKRVSLGHYPYIFPKIQLPTGALGDRVSWLTRQGTLQCCVRLGGGRHLSPRPVSQLFRND